MAGTTRLELATSAVTAPPDRFYNNLQDCGDCQGPPKSLKIAQDTAFVGWIVGESFFVKIASRHTGPNSLTRIATNSSTLPANNSFRVADQPGTEIFGIVCEG